MTEPFFMHHLWLDSRKLVELGKMLRLPLNLTDDDYLVHCALGELFGEWMPGSYALEATADSRARERFLPVLAYSTASASALRQHAELAASPTVFACLDWDRFDSKPMPTTFESGTRLGFQVKVCPTVRLASARDGHKKGAEIDAFVHRSRELDDPTTPIERDQVYSDWLRNYFEKRPEHPTGATLESVQLERFSLPKMMRRTQGDQRKARTFTLPAATLQGVLCVTDTALFEQTLRRGIGRHRSFGFGMLKLRPPPRG